MVWFSISDRAMRYDSDSVSSRRCTSIAPHVRCVGRSTSDSLVLMASVSLSVSENQVLGSDQFARQGARLDPLERIGRDVGVQDQTGQLGDPAHG